jgi:hypothetical protein
LAVFSYPINSTNIIVASGATLDMSANSFTLGGSQTLLGGGTINRHGEHRGGDPDLRGHGRRLRHQRHFNGSHGIWRRGRLVYFDVGTLARRFERSDHGVTGTLSAYNNFIHLKAPSAAASLAGGGLHAVHLAQHDFRQLCQRAGLGCDAGQCRQLFHRHRREYRDASLQCKIPGLPAAGVAVTPNPAVRNQNVLLTVHATNGIPGTVSSVVVDVELRLAVQSALALVPAGGNIWTNTVTITPDTVLGDKSLTATLTDTTSLSGVVTIPLTVATGNNVWSGADADNNFSSNLNWTNKTAPGYVGDSLEFAGNTRLTPNLNNSYTVAGVTFDSGAGAFTIGTDNGSTLTLGGGLVNNSANGQTLNVPVTLDAWRKRSTRRATTSLSAA